MKVSPCSQSLLVCLALITSLGAQNRTCVAPDNGTGTIDWPAPCPWGNALNPLLLETSPGERIAVSVSIPEFVDTCVPGNPPTYHSGLNSPDGPTAIPATILVERRGKVVEMPADLLLSATHTALSPLGAAEQSFDTEILSMELTSRTPAGPEFPDVSICIAPGGSSGGETTIRRLPSGNFHVDSFFDVFTEISVSGRPGTEWADVDVTEQAMLSLSQNLEAFDGVLFEPIGDAAVYNDGVCLQVDNLGSSGLDGVRVGSRKGYNAYQAQSASMSLAISPPSSGGLLPDGGSLAAYPFPPPPTDFPDLPDLPPSLVCTSSGGTVTGVCSSGGAGATEWIVEVVQGKDLKRTVVVPDGATCFSAPAINIKPIRLELSSVSPGGGGGGMIRISICNDGPTEFTLPGVPTPVVGDSISVSVRDPRVLPGFLEGVDLLCSQPLCVEAVEVGQFGVSHRALDNAVLSSKAGGLRVGNLGSSGCDGVSVQSDPPGQNWYPDCDDDGFYLPYRAELEPLEVEAHGGSFFVGSVDGAGDNVATAEYRGGGGGGGRVFVDYNTSSAVCRVAVLNNGSPVGEFDVPITANVLTEVCAVGTDATGNPPRLTGCGKLRIGWPWELSCLVEEFDRPVTLTPTGGSPLVGDELRLLAPGATPAEVESIRTIELRASGLPEIVICGSSTGPFLPSPVLPPSSETDWDFPGVGMSLGQEADTYYTWDPGTGTAVCASRTVRDIQFVSQNGNRRTFSATMDLHLEGVGGLVYSKDFELPGSFTVEYDNSPSSGSDSQQYNVSVRDWRFALAPGADPDIRTLRMVSGTDNGFPGGGDVDTRKIPECELEIQALLELLENFELEGSQGGGPLAGGGPVNEAQTYDVYLVGEVPARDDGIAFQPLGGADASSSSDVLVVSNIGSSGEDGVSIDLPESESASLTFSDLAPVDLQEDGEFWFTFRGRTAGRYRTWRTQCRRLPGPAGDSFFDIFLDVATLQPSGTTLEVFDAGVRVATIPGGANQIALEAHPTAPGGSLSPIKGCGKLPGRSETPCNFIRFCDPVLVRVNGQPDVVGDEVRLLVEGVSFESLSNLQLTFADTVGDVEISEQAVGLTGRDIVGGGGGAFRATDHNSSRSNKSSHSPIAFDPDGDDDDDTIGELEMRAPRSVFLPGQRQLWPLRCQLDPDSVVFDSPDGSMKFEACGTINSVPGASYGVLEACTDANGNFLLKGDFSSRGVSEVCIVVTKELDKSSPKLAEAVVPSGGNYAVIRPFRGGGAFPLGHVRAVPELYEPPHNEVECSYTLCFAEPVEITLPGLAPVVGTDIDVQLVAPTHVSADIECLRVSGSGFKPITIEGIGTGPFYGQGLVNATLGGAQIEEQTPGDRGPLVVSNIGSSGEDGVRIEIDQGEGVWQTLAPLDLGGGDGGQLTFAVSGEPCLGTPEACAELAATLSVDGDSWKTSWDPGEYSPSSNVAVLAGDPVAVKEILADGAAGKISSSGGVPVRLIGVGLLPPTIIEGVGSVGQCVAFQFAEPVAFTPSEGAAPVVCDTLRLFFDDGQPLVEAASVAVDVRGAGIPQLEVTDTRLFHLARQQYASLGVSELIADHDQLIVSNIGSSGQDGVRAYGRNPQTGKEIKIAARPAVFQSPPPAEGFPELFTTAHGVLNGVPDSQLGESRVTLGSAGGIVPIGVDFSSLGAPEVRVMVCDNLDNDCDGATDLLIAPALQLSADVCHLLAGPGDLPAVIGCGKLPGQPIPGGFQPPCFYWDFDQPYEFLPPGGEPGTGLLGCRLLLLAHGGGDFDTEIVSMDLRGTDPQLQMGPIYVLQPAGLAESFFDIWVELNFTPQEIAELDAAGYCLDIDGDGLCEVEEFILGLDPHVADSAGHQPSISSATVDGPAGLQNHVRIRYEFDPTKQGVRHELGVATDFVNYDYRPRDWRLVETEDLAGGNVRQTWEHREPISGNPRKGYKHRGHVTVLK